MNQLLIYNGVNSLLMQLNGTRKTDLADRQTRHIHQLLLFLFRRIRMSDVVRKPHAKSVRDGFGQVSASSLLLRVAVVGTGVEAQWVVAVAAAGAEGRPVNVLAGVVGVFGWGNSAVGWVVRGWSGKGGV